MHVHMYHIYSNPRCSFFPIQQGVGGKKPCLELECGLGPTAAAALAPALGQGRLHSGVGGAQGRSCGAGWGRLRGVWPGGACRTAHNGSGAAAALALALSWRKL